MSPPPAPRLPVNRVDLWVIRAADFAGAAPAGLLDALSSHEAERARSFLRPPDARLYCLAHGVVRVALTHYFERPPAGWQFLERPGGKPALADPPAPLEFNLSHSRGLAVAAFTTPGPVGVDIEPLSRAPEVRGLINEQFNGAEHPWLNEPADAGRDERAVWLWTAHEALLKACGQGMAMPSRSIAIEWSRPNPPGVRQAPSAVGVDWRLCPVRVGPDFLGTIVLPGARRFHGVHAVRITPDASAEPFQPLEIPESPSGFLEIDA